MTKYFVDKNGVYLGGFDNGDFKGKSASAKPPKNAIEVSAPPNDGRDIWNGNSWDAYQKSIGEQLSETEDISVVARKLEEIIDNIENSTPLSQSTKDWMSNRKALR